MPTTYGQITTGNIAGVQRRIDLTGKILRLEPDASPLTCITRLMKNNKMATNNVQFQWVEQERLTRFDSIPLATTNVQTSIAVTTGALFGVGTLIKVPRTGEVMEVTAVTGNNLTVVRGIGTSAAATNAAEPLYILGRAAEEGGISLQPIANDPTSLTNNTQIFKRSVEISGSAGSEANITQPHDWAFQHETEAMEHLLDMETSFMFGKPGTATSVNGKPVRYTGGVLHFASQNGVNAGGVLTEAGFETFLRGAFRYGSDKKTLFASPLLVSVLNSFSQTKLNTRVGEDTYGVAITQWVSPHGTINIVKHNLLEGATWGGYGVLLDMGRNNVSYRYLDGGGPLGSRDTKLLRNRQANDRDGQLDEWITEAGLQFGQSKTHAVLTGVTG